MSTTTTQPTSVGTSQDSDYKYESGDSEKFKHYVHKRDWDNIIAGVPVTALCGKTWMPSRDPGRFPMCPPCQEVYRALPGGGLPDA